ncbi:MAG: septum formation initiator family protein [Candidatus Pacebacteria bacterium]|nr:septum formation initiator family protein [Candidatus Paceibacterota bacterium]
MVAKFRKIKKKGLKKNSSFSILITLILVSAIVLLINTNVKIGSKRQELISRANSLKEQIENIEEKNSILKESISRAETNDYVEKIAREQLGMKKPGEEVVVINKEKNEKESVESKSSQVNNSWSFKAIWDWLKSRF